MDGSDPAPGAPARRATIRDVARAAGVSKSLVSLVYASPLSVSDQRRQRVLEAAARLDFRPNQAARSLAAPHGGFVGIVVADLRNPVFADIVDAAQEALAEAGAIALVTTATSQASALQRGGLDVFGDLRPSGLLVAGSVPDAHRVARIVPGRALVVASAVAEGLPGAATVRSDDLTGMRLLVDHLVGLGHRDIAHLGGQGGAEALVRARGYAEAMRAHGLAARARVEPAAYSAESGYDAMRRLLAGARLPTAVVAVNDLAAAGALSALHAGGHRIAVTGYDGTYLGALAPLSLTTIDTHPRTIGALAARLLLDGHEGAETLVPPSLVVRASSFPASAGRAGRA